jgi:hypothetical protein
MRLMNSHGNKVRSKTLRFVYVGFRSAIQQKIGIVKARLNIGKTSRLSHVIGKTKIGEHEGKRRRLMNWRTISVVVKQICGVRNDGAHVFHDVISTVNRLCLIPDEIQTKKIFCQNEIPKVSVAICVAYIYIYILEVCWAKAVSHHRMSCVCLFRPSVRPSLCMFSCCLV